MPRISQAPLTSDGWQGACPIEMPSSAESASSASTVARPPRVGSRGSGCLRSRVQQVATRSFRGRCPTRGRPRAPALRARP
jgi:hypothetical protein